MTRCNARGGDDDTCCLAAGHPGFREPICPGRSASGAETAWLAGTEWRRLAEGAIVDLGARRTAKLPGDNSEGGER